MATPPESADHGTNPVDGRDPPVIEDVSSQDFLPETAFSRVADGFIGMVGTAVSFLWPAVMLAIVGNVIARYALASNIGQLEELQWHLYAVAFLFGLAYAASRDQHIRIDVLYAGFSPRLKTWVELIGLLVFAIPFTFVILRYAWPFLVASFEINERSEQPSGLPLRWIIKSMLFFAFALLAVAFASRLSRVTARLFGFPRPRWPSA